MLAYHFVQGVLRAATNVFFREIHLVGMEHVPGEGEAPTIFVGNHPNSLMDPALVVATSGRVVHFAAKDKLFAFPMGLVLNALGAVPISRQMDQKKGEVKGDNSGALDALSDVLSQGRSVGIFPEGLSHDKAHLQRVRSGAARIALTTATKHPTAGMVIVPVGLTYMHRKSFRSQVLVQFGPSIAVDGPWIERWAEDQREAAKALTSELESGIRALTINAPDWETLRVLDGVRRMYQPQDIGMADRVELARRFCDAYADLKAEAPIREVFTEVKQYLDALEDLGIDDRDLRRGVSARRLATNLLRLLFYVPVAIPGLPVFGPLFLAIHWMGVEFSPRKDVIGTSRMVFGLISMFVVWTALPLLAYWFVGPYAGLAVAIAVPTSGFALVKVLERTLDLRRLWTSAVAALTISKRMAVLQGRRDALEQRIVALVNQYMPEDMVPLFKRESTAEAPSGS